MRKEKKTRNSLRRKNCFLICPRFLTSKFCFYDSESALIFLGVHIYDTISAEVIMLPHKSASRWLQLGCGHLPSAARTVELVDSYEMLI